MAKRRKKTVRRAQRESTPPRVKLTTDSDPCHDVDWPHLIKMGIEERDKHLEHVRRLIGQYVGSFYKTGMPNTEGVLANHAAELIAVLVPQLASGTPYGMVSAAEVGVSDEEVYGFQSTINTWMESVDFRAFQEEAVTAYCFFGYTWRVALEKKFADEVESSDPALIPVAEVLPWDDVVWDPCTRKLTRALFRGHRTITTRRELLERAEAHPEEEWDVDAIKLMRSSSHESSNDRGVYIDESRDEVEFWTLWVPGLRNDEKEYPQAHGYHGKELTVCLDLGAPTRNGFIREPQPFFGPRWGPYGECSAYVVPFEPVGISPLVSDAMHAESLNDVETAIAKADYKYRKFIATLGNRTDVAELLLNIENDGVVNFQGSEDLGKHVQPFEVFGSTRWMHATQQYRREALDRKSGLFDAILGNTTGQATATENTIADRANTNRFSQHSIKNAAAFSLAIRTASWYMNAAKGFRQNIPPEVMHRLRDPDTGRRRRPEEYAEGEFAFEGGATRDGKSDWADDFDRYQISIDIGSAALTADQKKARLLQSFQFFLGVQQTIALNPGLDGERINRFLADLFNEPRFLTFSNPGKAQEIAALQAAAGANGGQGAQAAGGQQQTPQMAPPAAMASRVNVTTPPVAGSTKGSKTAKKIPQYGSDPD